MIFCSASSRDGSMVLERRGARGALALAAGPAAAAFLRGVPGVAATVTFTFGAARLRGAGAVVAGGAAGFLAMTAYSGGRQVFRLVLGGGEADFGGRGVVLAHGQKHPMRGGLVGEGRRVSRLQARGAQAQRGPTGQRTVIVGRPGHHGKWNCGHHRPPMPPTRQLLQIIRPHQPDEAGMGEAHAELAQGIDGVAGAKSGFDIGGDYVAAIAEGAGAGQPVGQRAHAFRRFERVARGDQQPDLIQPQAAFGHGGDVQMAGMGGVEGPAEQADAQTPAVAERADLGMAGGFQGRICPVPVTR